MSPVRLFGGSRALSETAEARKAVWGCDPVHPAPEMYSRIAEELIVELAKVAAAKSGKDRKCGPPPGRGNEDSKRQKMTSGSASWRGGRGRPFPYRGGRRGGTLTPRGGRPPPTPRSYGGNYGGGSYGRGSYGGQGDFRGHWGKRGRAWRGN